MSRGAWNVIKSSKSFYVNTYRKAGTLIVILMVINLLLICAIRYRYFYMPATQFYATNGVTPPIELTPLNAPNYSEKPLLPNEVGEKNTKKIIPQ